MASGQPFNVFVKERILKPLKMNDTDFTVPESKWSRFTTVYSPDGKGGIRPMSDPEAFGNTHMSPWALYKEGRTYFSGGAGLASTASDYARFANMLLNGGSLDGVRLLGPKTIELMTRSHTSELTPPLQLLGPGSNFGLGFRVVTDLRIDADAWLGRALRLERHLRHELLGRSEGEAGRRDDGAEVSGRDGVDDLPADGVSGADKYRGLTKLPAFLLLLRSRKQPVA